MTTSLVEWSKIHPRVYCPHRGTGTIQFDPGMGTKHFDPWWALLITDEEIIRYYAWLLKKYGIPVWLSKHWGPHISIIKNEEPTFKYLWGVPFGPFEFYYSNHIRWDNNVHAWIDVYSPHLSALRRLLGLSAKEWFHLTIGRLQ